MYARPCMSCVSANLQRESPHGAECESITQSYLRRVVHFLTSLFFSALTDQAEYSITLDIDAWQDASRSSNRDASRMVARSASRRRQGSRLLLLGAAKSTCASSFVRAADGRSEAWSFIALFVCSVIVHAHPFVGLFAHPHRRHWRIATSSDPPRLSFPRLATVGEDE